MIHQKYIFARSRNSHSKNNKAIVTKHFCEKVNGIQSQILSIWHPIAAQDLIFIKPDDIIDGLRARNTSSPSPTRDRISPG